jgi:hypothetical protein
LDSKPFGSNKSLVLTLAIISTVFKSTFLHMTLSTLALERSTTT